MRDHSYHVHGNVDIAVLRKLLDQDWDVHIEHSFCEANFCAHFLAKLGAQCSSMFITLDTPPVGMLQHRMIDALGISFVRP